MCTHIRACDCPFVIVPAAPHLGHRAGSVTRPRSTNVASGMWPHCAMEQRNSACFRSGMMLLVRVTIPRTQIIWSMSDGFRSRMGLHSRSAKVRTWIWGNSSCCSSSTCSA
jgi:hypothetical protein